MWQLRRNLIGATAEFSPAPSVPRTWSPTDKSANVSLSGGNLIATATSAFQAAARGTVALSTGTPSFSIVLGGADSAPFRLGIANASQALGTSVGVSANSCGANATGTVYINNVSIGTGAAFAIGNSVEVRPNLDLDLFFYRVNGGNWNNNASADPVTGVGGLDMSTLAAGPYFPMFSAFDANTHTVTGDFTSWT